MIRTYEGYLKHPAGDLLPMEEALKIYTRMAESIEKCTLEDKMDFWNDFLSADSRYAAIRSAWETMSIDEKKEEDSGRTIKHNSVISHIDILSRIVEKEGGDSSWRKDLGDSRKKIGDFACFVAYITGIANR